LFNIFVNIPIKLIKHTKMGLIPSVHFSRPWNGATTLKWWWKSVLVLSC